MIYKLTYELSKPTGIGHYPAGMVVEYVREVDEYHVEIRVDGYNMTVNRYQLTSIGT